MENEGSEYIASNKWVMGGGGKADGRIKKPAQKANTGK